MRAQFAKTMESVGLEDSRLVVLVGDIGTFSLRGYEAQCPGRFFNVGIREQTLASAAAGMAIMGYVPVIHSITPFIVERCFEQLKDDFCYQRLPGNVVSVGAGFDYSALGCTHHSYSDIAMLKSLPGVQIVVPGSQTELDRLFRQTYDRGTLNYFRVGARVHDADIPLDQIQIGKGVFIREGADLTIIAAGQLLRYAIEAAKELSSHCSCEIVYIHSIKPFDAEIVRESVKKTKNIIVLEDHSIYGGLGDEVRRAVTCGTGIPARIRSLGVQDDFLREYGDFDHLAKVAGVDTASVVRAARELVP